MSGFTRKDVIKGVNFFVGNVDGTDYNNGKIFIEEPLVEKNGSSKGFRTVEYKCENSTPVKAIIHNEFPLTCEVAYDLQSDAKGHHVIVVKSIKPLGSAQPMPRAA